MKVKELTEKLKDFDPESEIVLCRLINNNWDDNTLFLSLEAFNKDEGSSIILINFVIKNGSGELFVEYSLENEEQS